MRPSVAAWLLAACGCAIDDRDVALNAACVEPPTDGTIADFSEARARSCPAGFCAPELVGSGAVTLGEGKLAGLVFPYTSGELVAADVNLWPPAMPDDPEPASDRALWAFLDSGQNAGATGNESAPDGFVLEFVQCIDAAPYTAITFNVEEQAEGLGGCPLGVAALMTPPGSAMLGEAHPLSELGLDPAEIVDVTPGTVTLPLGPSKVRSGHSALGGLAWEFSIPGDGRGCTATLTIDDIRLVR